jgi:8-oxo-dGTP diphosphatase
MIDVVGGIVVREDRLLLTQRPASKDFPLTWECPGGKVESGETHRQALDREIHEEVDLVVMLVEDKPVWRSEFHNEVERHDRRHIELFFYLVRQAVGDVIPRERQGFGWFRRHEVEALRMAGALAPGNAKAHEAILAAAFGSAGSLTAYGGTGSAGALTASGVSVGAGGGGRIR